MKIKKVEDAYKTKWLTMKSATYVAKNGKEMKWDYVSRNGNTKIVTVICRSKQHNRYLLISQPRVSVNKTVIEFPAGLIDEGETIEEAGLRELKEETGYDGEVVATHPFVVKSAGLADEVTAVVEVLIDEKAVGKAEMEDTEDIQSFWLSRIKIVKMLKEIDLDTHIVDSHVYFYFLGANCK